MTEIEYKIYIDDIIRRVEMARIKVSAHHIVKIVAISKYSTSSDIEKLYNIGQRAYGENKVQNLKQKSIDLEELPLEWHFVGNLQKNKINNLLDIDPTLFHSLDSLDLALELQKKLLSRDMGMDALLQVNSANEDTKSGVKADNAKSIYEQITTQCANINLRGVMSIGAHSDDKKLIKESFTKTHEIYKQLNNADICSMGMSGDFELAIECGSNMVRLGSVLFPKDLG